ncbi:hypothetical protein BKA62DRAFT_471195 [Auriculariales sp. MPI-PUGE-AT-0066]|nr:hypothetical protein BKA62DRAFT_471195 [Auriculariales sp. MPI-PUGE-AT-0066]
MRSGAQVVNDRWRLKILTAVNYVACNRCLTFKARVTASSKYIMPSSSVLLALTVLHRAVEAASIAPAQILFGSVLVFLESMAGARQNREDLAILREYVCTTALAIHDELERLHNAHVALPDDMILALDSMATVLGKVQRGLDELDRRNKLAKFIRKDPISNIIAGFMQDFRHSFAVFQLSGNLIAIVRTAEYNEQRQDMTHLLVKQLSEQIQQLEAAADAPIVPGHILPPAPQVLFGRNLEIEAIVTQFLSCNPLPARIALIGPGGVGKTSLARRILHDNRIKGKFGQNRLYIACDAVTRAQSLPALVAQQLGVTSDQPMKAVHRLLSSGPPVFLIFDNFETPWEPKENRAALQDQLSSFATLETVTILITLRGGERPIGTAWSRPLLPQLAPLQREDAQQAFSQISGLFHNNEDLAIVNKLLAHVDYLPLAVSILANLAQHEPLSRLLERWNAEKTASVAAPGHENPDKLASLDVSIRLSISSPRMCEHGDMPLQLLSFISLFPDGIPLTSPLIELMEESFKMPQKSISVLKQVALASEELSSHRIRVLSPIRSYILKYHPPASEPAFAVLKGYFLPMTKVVRDLARLGVRQVGSRLCEDFGNMSSCLDWAISRGTDGHDTGWAVEACLEIAPFSFGSGGHGVDLAVVQRCYDLCIASGNTVLAARALLPLATRSGARSLGRERLRHAVQLAEQSGDEAVIALCLMTKGAYCSPGPEGDGALRDALQRYQELARVSSNPQAYAVEISRTYYGLSRCSYFSSNYADCVAYGIKSEEAIGGLNGSASETNRARNFRAWGLLKLGQFSEAEILCQETLAAMALDDIPFISAYPEFVNLIAEICRLKCQPYDALAAHMRAAAWFKAAKKDDEYGWTLVCASLTAVDTGDLEHVMELQKTSLALLSKSNNEDGVQLARSIAAHVAIARHDWEEAEANALFVRSIGWKHRRRERVGDGEQLLASIDLGRGNVHTAVTHALVSIASIALTRAHNTLMGAIDTYAQCLLALEDPQLVATAMVLAHIMMTAAAPKQVLRAMARAMELYGAVHAASGARRAAKRQYERALKIYDTGRMALRAERCRAKLEELGDF